MLSSSFTGIENYMRPLGEVVNDPEAMKKFGQTMVLCRKACLAVSTAVDP
jgi:selenium-binding protein 1